MQTKKTLSLPATPAGRSPGPGRPIAAGAVTVALAGLLAACAGPEGPNPDIERARVDVNRVAAMPVVTQYAPLELKQAVDTVEQGDRQWRDDGDSDEARHDAYLAEGRAAIAANYARARDADVQLERTKAQADAQRLDARTREAELANRRADAADQRASQLQAQLSAIQAQQTERGLLVSLGGVLFETGQARLLSPSYPRLDKLAEFLNQHPDRRLLIEGYTDTVGNDSSNLALSQRRADAVRLELIKRGVDPRRITTRGYGESYPVADNSNAEGRALNRRVEVVITDERGNLRPRG